MVPNISHIWRKPLRDVNLRIDQSLAAAGLKVSGVARVYFRADDVAVPSRRFERLIRMFKAHRVPLALAVVPAWLTPSHWRALLKMGQGESALWCWHQHGWRHINHETAGKKAEFGPGRSPSAVNADLIKGYRKLTAIMAEQFTPLFTPPWNRCSDDTLRLLKKNGYRAVSRFRGAQPEAPDGLVDLQLNVDLHTRRDMDANHGWNTLFEEFQKGIVSGCCGIMIHHRRMNDAAFVFLDHLLVCLKRNKQLHIVGSKDLVP